MLPKGRDSDNISHYEVVFIGSPSIGRVATKMRILVQGLEKPYVEVPVIARVSGNLRYSKNLHLLKRNGVFPPKNIVISTRDGAPLTVERVEDPNNLLKLTIEKNNAPTVQIRAQVANPNFENDVAAGNKLFIHTSDKDEPTIEVNYKINTSELSTIRRNPRKRIDTRARGWKKRFKDKSEVQK